MEEDKSLEIHHLKAKIAELQIRINNPCHWSEGELTQIRRKLRIANLRLIEITHEAK